MSTCSTWPGLAPLTATGPVHMWPGTILRLLLAWMAGRAGGTTSGLPGIMSGTPETLEIVTRPPLPVGRSGAKAAAEKPPVTVAGGGLVWGVGQGGKRSWAKGAGIFRLARG